MPGVVRALEGLLEDATAGDPISALKWTHRSTRRLAKALHGDGIPLSANTVARRLRQRGFSLRTNRKRLAEVSDPNRDRQFRSLSRLRRLYVTLGLPVISVDTKKKALIGPFKNPGQTWRRQPKPVFAHDFPSWAEGRAVPYGIYDVAHNDGLVVVGTAHETPTFAVSSIRRLWLLVGRQRYPQAKRLLIEANAGGANDARKWQW